MTIDGYAYVLSDLNGVFLSIDDRYCELLGRERQEILGKTSADFTAFIDQDVTASAVERLRTLAEPLIIRKRYARKDGTLVAVENHASLIRDGVGPARMIATVQQLPHFDRLAQVDELRESAISVRGEGAIRSSVFGEDRFRDPRWDMLLTCYILEAEGNSRSIAALCSAANTRAGDGPALVNDLIRLGELEIEREAVTLAQSTVRLSPAAHRRFVRYFDWLWDQQNSGDAHFTPSPLSIARRNSS